MKRLLAVLVIALTLPFGIASAEYMSIIEMRETLPARWTQTYETKWRIIEIDVQPTVPRVDRAPILVVVADTEIPDITPLGDEWVSEQAYGWFYASINDGGSKDTIHAEKRLGGVTTSMHYYPPLDMNRAYAENNDMTLGEALEHYKDLLIAIGEDPEDWQCEQPYDVLCNKMVKKKTGEFLLQGNYYISLHQKLHGIPLLCHAGWGVQTDDAEPRYDGRALFQIRTPDACDFSWKKVKITNELAEDVPLRDFAAVQASLEKEIQEGHIREIFQMDFGYALFNEPGAVRTTKWKEPPTNHFYAIPVWRVECFYMADGKKEMSNHSNPNVSPIPTAQMEYTTILVNAQTGEVLDRSGKSKRCADYRGFISWEDVGGKK